MKTTSKADPSHIQEALLAALREAWLRNPEQRLGQLLVNAADPRTPCAELFYLEDQVLLERLKATAAPSPAR